MNTVAVSDVGENFKAHIKKSKKQPVIIVEGGEPVAVLLSVSEKDDIERVLLACNPGFQALMNDADRRIKKTGGIKHDDFWKSVEETEGSEQTEMAA
ncbi:MAG: hypothetical protein DRI57_17735 [Deltaproteobacteria bacterium]|nr:MAG: hypothetical protein DRI57_17735 [Deltaproteobacteria bacterium]